MRNSIKIVHAALDQLGNEIILRGVLDPDSFDQLQSAPYQREILPLAKINELVAAFETSAVPDIELGMRGGDYMERNGDFYLKDEVYIIDGLQRVSAGRLMMQRGGDKKPHLGATVHEWERARFRILNLERTKLSPNILLRNLQHDYDVIAQLYGLCANDRAFVMHDKVCWTQRMKRSELLSALGFCKIVGALHSHLGPGRSHRTEELSRGLQKIMEAAGPNVMRDNVRHYFDVVDQCWGIRPITFREGAAYLRMTFQLCLATLFSRHQDFWRAEGKRLFVDKELIRKIRIFPVSDPQVVQLAAASGKAGEILYQLLLNHVNSGKRTRRLTPNEMAADIDLDETAEERSDEVLSQDDDEENGH